MANHKDDPFDALLQAKIQPRYAVAIEKIAREYGVSSAAVIRHFVIAGLAQANRLPPDPGAVSIKQPAASIEHRAA